MLVDALVAFLLYCYDDTICTFINEKVICNIETMKTEIYNRLDANRGNVSLQARSLFDKIWSSFIAIADGENNLKIPPHIVWLNGAPGSGKGTNGRSIMKAMDIFSKPVVVSDLLNSDENRGLMDSGSLVDDEKVIKIVFEKLLDGNTCRGGAIIDGFPRTLVQAECVYLLMEKIKTLHAGKDTKVSVITLLVDEKTSIERQLHRGRMTILHNESIINNDSGVDRSAELQEVRKTDTDTHLARERYQIFLDQTKSAIGFMKDMFSVYEISTAGSFDETKDRIYKTLRQEKL
ncbi:MAG: nucleoside monophosphate kinase [Puniceicoccales bacterium]|jgi:adenylate kinase|nr:nucleoside monophosphate kinase [Puniceicoccales bacterium]